MLAKIEFKEKERAERQEEFKRDAAIEEIALSEVNRAQVEARKKELDAMLADMQQDESDFDELDEEFDGQLDQLLGPEIDAIDSVLAARSTTEHQHD